jgi:transcriptional regulator with XRE-family HTH domain
VPKKNEVESWFDLDLEAVGYLFRTVRERDRFSVRDLSEITRISASQILRIESGKSEYSIVHFFSICSALGLVPGEVLEYATDFQTDGVEFNELEMIQICPYPADISEIEGIVFGCWFIAVHLIWSPDPLGRAVLCHTPSQKHRDKICEYAIMVSALAPSERRELLHSLCQRAVTKLKSLGLLPEGEEWKDYIGKPRHWGSDGLYPEGIWAIFKESGEDKIRDKNIDMVNQDFTLVGVTWESLKARLLSQTAHFGAKAGLARQVGVSRQVMNAWLNGKAQPSASQTLKLLDWVEQSERKQNTPASATNTRKGEQTRKRKQSNEPKSGPPGAT